MASVGAHDRDAHEPAGSWPAPHALHPAAGTVRVPGSKSMTNRHLVLGALAEGVSILHRPLVSRDSTLMRDALTQLGTRCTPQDRDAAWHIQPPAQLEPTARIDAGLAGTVMRFLPPVSALARGATTFDGDVEARARPIGPLLQALVHLGVDIGSGDDRRPATHLPFTVHGTGVVRGGEVAIDASSSSQFVSALLLAGARFEQGLTLRHVGSTLPSRPHIEMTLQALGRVGVEAGEVSTGVWRVEPGPMKAIEVDIEPDLSSAAPFLALAAVTSGSVTVAGWPGSTTQAGDAMRSILGAMGASTELTSTGLEVTGPEPGALRGLDIDLHDVGELTPVVAALAAQASTASRLRGVAHLRGHETDRLQALQTELSRMGGEVEVTDDGLLINPVPLHGALLRTYHDHRMAMAAAVLGAGVPGVRVENVATTAKTFPGFASTWSQLVDAEPAPA